jgi:hypothetical protein
MTTLNPRNGPRLPDWLDPHEGRRSPGEIDQEALERCCMAVAFCLCFAVLAPPDLMPFAEDEAQIRHPNPAPEDIAAAEAKEAALSSRQKTATQLRRSFAPLAVHIRGEARRGRKRFIQRGQRTWDKANPTPLTWELQKILTAEFMKTYVGINRL